MDTHLKYVNYLISSAPLLKNTTVTLITTCSKSYHYCYCFCCCYSAASTFFILLLLLLPLPLILPLILVLLLANHTFYTLFLIIMQSIYKATRVCLYDPPYITRFSQLLHWKHQSLGQVLSGHQLGKLSDHSGLCQQTIVVFVFIVQPT